VAADFVVGKRAKALNANGPIALLSRELTMPAARFGRHSHVAPLAIAIPAHGDRAVAHIAVCVESNRPGHAVGPKFVKLGQIHVRISRPRRLHRVLERHRGIVGIRRIALNRHLIIHQLLSHNHCRFRIGRIVL
jgi:hypothetical protein